MRVSGWLYLLEQTGCSACLLLAIGLSAGLKRHHPVRILSLSALLAVCTMAALPLPPWLRILLTLPISTLSPILAYPDAPFRLRLRMALTGLSTSLCLTGTLRLLAPLTFPGILLLAAACAALSLSPRIMPPPGSLPCCTSAVIRCGIRQTTLTALVDSGNLLRDAITGLPVIVISRRAASEIVALPPDGTLLPGMRLISVRTISGKTLMTVLRPDSIRILSGAQWQNAEALIGLSPDGYDGFQALVPACLVASAPLPRQEHLISQGG